MTRGPEGWNFNVGVHPASLTHWVRLDAQGAETKGPEMVILLVQFAKRICRAGQVPGLRHAGTFEGRDLYSPQGKPSSRCEHRTSWDGVSQSQRTGEGGADYYTGLDRNY